MKKLQFALNGIALFCGLLLITDNNSSLFYRTLWQVSDKFDHSVTFYNVIAFILIITAIICLITSLAIGIESAVSKDGE